MPVWMQNLCKQTEEGGNKMRYSQDKWKVNHVGESSKINIGWKGDLWKAES